MAAEKDFENRIKRYLDSKGVWWVKFFANRNTRAGIPDLLTCVNGQFLAIEVKAPYGKPSPLQLHHCDKIIDAGGVALVVWPSDFDALQEVVTRLLERRPVDDLIFARRYLHPMSV